MTKPTLVITRPADLAAPLVAACQAAGIEPWLCPLFHFVALNDALATLNQQAKNADVVVFVSPTTVRFAQSYLDWQNLTAQIACVGHATQDALIKAGASTVYAPPTSEDSEGLLQWSRWRTSGQVLIVGASGGRMLLGDSLTQQGWQVHRSFIYKRLATPPSLPTQAQLAALPDPVGVYLSSSQAAEVWCRALDRKYSDRLQSLLYLILHPRIGLFLDQPMQQHVLFAGSDPEYIVNLLKQQWRMAHD